MRFFLLLALLLLASPLHSADSGKIVGTWKLVSVVYEDAQTKERTPVLGEHPRGYQIATPEGRWSRWSRRTGVRFLGLTKTGRKLCAR
jgi:hypothetical protein